MQQEMIKVVVDAMGGDYAPVEPVKAAVDAVAGRKDIKVLLVGQQDVVEAELKKYDYPKEQIEVIHAEEVIETAEPPVNAIRRKKQSSMVVGMNLVKNKEADAKKKELADAKNDAEQIVFMTEKAIKDFLMAGFTGMTAGKEWDGKEQVNGGYIVVMDDGDVLCYHSNDRESFRDYLYKNTHFEYVSADKYVWSRILKIDNEFYLPLNVSVRFNTHTR